MKKALIYLVFSTTISFGQNFDTIKRIEISYGYGEQCFPKNGIYSRSEKFIIEKSESKNFYLTRYIKFKSRKKGAIFSKDSLLTILGGKIDSNLINDLIANLNTNKNNFSFTFLKSKLKEPTRKQIKNLARKRDEIYKIECDGLFDCENRNQIIDSIIGFEKFEKFVAELNLSSNQMIVIGYWNEARIDLYSDKNIVTFKFPFMNNKIGQPIIKTYNENYLNDYSCINLIANEVIRQIIPEKSITFKAFDLKNLNEDYINWFLKNN